MIDDLFTLSNGPAPMKPLACPQQKARQGVLFSGFKSCLPGQLDLIQTDGREEAAPVVAESEAIISVAEEGEPSSLERMVARTAAQIDPELWETAGRDLAGAISLADDRATWAKLQDLWVLQTRYKPWYVWTIGQTPKRLRPASDVEVCLAILHPLSHLVIDGRECLVTY